MKKSVIITGACGGIGSAIALEFKKNDLQPISISLPAIHESPRPYAFDFKTALTVEVLEIFFFIFL